MTFTQIGDAILTYFVDWVPILTIPVMLFAFYDLWKTIKVSKQRRMEREKNLLELKEALGDKLSGLSSTSLDSVDSIRDHLVKEMNLAIEENSRTFKEFNSVVNQLQEEISRLQSELEEERSKNSGGKP